MRLVGSRLLVGLSVVFVSAACRKAPAPIRAEEDAGPVPIVIIEKDAGPVRLTETEDAGPVPIVVRKDAGPERLWEKVAEIDGGPPCAIGELTGFWRNEYFEIEGNCGPIPTEVIDMQAAHREGSAEHKIATACQYHRNVISQDRCKVEMSFTCPDGMGHVDVRWNTAHTSSTVIEGTMHRVVVDGMMSCKGTYRTKETRVSGPAPRPKPPPPPPPPPAGVWDPL